MADASDGKLYQLASFSVGGEGGNPAGVWIGGRVATLVTN